MDGVAMIWDRWTKETDSKQTLAMIDGDMWHILLVWVLIPENGMVADI